MLYRICLTALASTTYTDTHYLVTMWDVSGTKRMTEMSGTISSADALMLVYDVNNRLFAFDTPHCAYSLRTRRQSFIDLNKHWRNFFKLCDIDPTQMPCVVVGTKSDLPRKV
jgi:GTPase SAR1 family protein